MDVIDFLKALLTTLNNIEVKGKQNLDRLYSSIRATESMIESISQQKGGEEDGRQADIESDTGDNSTGQ